MTPLQTLRAQHDKLLRQVHDELQQCSRVSELRLVLRGYKAELRQVLQGGYSTELLAYELVLPETLVAQCVGYYKGLSFVRHGTRDD